MSTNISELTCSCLMQNRLVYWNHVLSFISGSPIETSATPFLFPFNSRAPEEAECWSKNVKMFVINFIYRLMAVWSIYVHTNWVLRAFKFLLFSNRVYIFCLVEIISKIPYGSSVINKIQKSKATETPQFGILLYFCKLRKKK